MSCEAPHNNPLDAENPDYPYVTLEGNVQTYSIPRNPLPNVKVYSSIENISKTDVQGYFKINKLLPADCWFYFEKDGYRKDSTFVKWEGAKKKSVEVFLNQIPVLDSLYVYSSVINRFTLPQIKQIYIKAKISDKDNDVDSVFVECKELNFKNTLKYNVDTKSFEKELTSYELNISSIDEAVGMNFNIIVKDVNNNLTKVGNGQIKRVINDVIQYVSPANYDTVSSLPTLKWISFEPGFTFSFLVQIYSYDTEFNPQLIWQKENISMDSVSISVDKALPE
ncbi:MAG: hypothetical protein N3A61_09675, partial [Ignavibacteria bacterium]|nr:hypothetical protein [Ignavibacteria bacterium]